MNLAFKSILSVRKHSVLTLVFLLLSIAHAQTTDIWDGTVDTEWYNKNISADTFYIGTAKELAGLETFFPTGSAATQTFANKTIVLMNDIMLNDTANWENWGTNPPKNSWKPIAAATSDNAARQFQGIFEGNGYIISGIYISNNQNALNPYYQGLFGNINSNSVTTNGTVKNLGITASYIRGGQHSGGIVGRNRGNVINSFSIGTKVVTNGTAEIGGLVGINQGGKLNNCYSTGSVSDLDGDFAQNGGGLVGSKSSGTVSDSYYDNMTSVADRTFGKENNGDDGKTTEEMQSQDFADLLNLNAGFIGSNEWEIGKFGYPTLKHSLAQNPFDGKYASGDGKEATPYIIKTVLQLKNLSELASKFNLKGYYFKLENNIEFQAGDNPWTPIGPSTKPFNGNFDGAGKTISGISTSQSKDYQGLFGYIGSDGTVKNLGMINSDIKGKDYAGGIAGYSAGTISNSHSTATVSGNNYVGGFVGHNAGTINSSYSTGNVSGTDYVGGFAGNNAKDIGIVYSSGKVTGTAKNVGGFAGYNCESCKIIGGYYNKSINSELSDPRVEGIADAEMKSTDFMKELNNIAAAFDANEWITVEGGYPVLGSNIAEYNLANYFAEGQGTETAPYLISTSKHLDYLSLLVGAKNENLKAKFFKLSNNIELNSSKNFTPIGVASFYSPTNQPFQGTFDGDSYTISGLYINSNVEQFTGLFGYVDNGKLKNIKITNSEVKGKNQVGGLVGTIVDKASLIENCSFSGTVTGTGNYVGGLVGTNHNAKIKNSHSTGNVNGIGYEVGGLAGSNYGAIEGSYSASMVKGDDNKVGGLVGYNYFFTGAIATIDNSYSIGTVTGTNSVGGLVGESNNSNIKKSYSTSTVTGNTRVGGLFGNALGCSDCYATGNVNGKTEVGGLVGYLNTSDKDISNSYSTGKVTGNSDKGGLIGKKSTPTAGATNSYYNKTINDAFDDDSEGRTTTELKQRETESTFVEWDFENTWAIDDEGIINNGYPYLQGIGEDMLICVADGKHKWGDGCELKTEQELCDEDANKVWEDDVCKTKGEFPDIAALNTIYSPTLKLLDLNLPDGYNWVAPNTILNANDNQEFDATYTRSGYTEASGKITVNVAKANGEVLPSPELESITTKSITIKSVIASTGQTIEYGINTVPADATATWQANLEFTGLDPETAYYIFARAVENANYLAAISPSLLVTTEAESSSSSIDSYSSSSSEEAESSSSSIDSNLSSSSDTETNPSSSSVDVSPIRSPQIASGNIRAQAIGNAIVLENLPQNAKVEVYNLQGKRIYSTTSHSPLATSHLKILVQTKGIYLVRINNQSSLKVTM